MYPQETLSIAADLVAVCRKKDVLIYSGILHWWFDCRRDYIGFRGVCCVERDQHLF